VSTDDLEKITSSDDSLEASNLEATESLAKSEQVLKLESEALAAELQENATTAFENDYASDDAVLDNLVEERRAQARKDEAIYEERQAARREEARLEAKREEARDFELAQEEKKYEAGIEARRVDIKLADSKLADKIRVAKEVYKRVETFVTEVQPKVQSAITNVDITPDIEGSLRQLESLLILYQKPLAMSAKGVLLLKLALAKLAKGQVTLNLKDRVVQVLSKIRALGVDNLSPKQIELIKLALFEISAKEPALRGLVFRTITEIDIAVSVAKKNQERRQTQAIA
jgi:hypothetical protein